MNKRWEIIGQINDDKQAIHLRHQEGDLSDDDRDVLLEELDGILSDLMTPFYDEPLPAQPVPNVLIWD